MKTVPTSSESERLSEFVLVVALLAFGVWWRYGERFDWWIRLSPFVKRLVEGTLFLSFGGVCLWNRSDRKAWFPTSAWDLRLFLFDVAFVIAGSEAGRSV